MKTFGEIICLLGILMFKLMLCSADDGLTKSQLEKIYKLSDAKGDTIDGKNYKIIKGEIIEEPTKKIWMKMEKLDESQEVTEKLDKLSVPKASGSKKSTEAGSKKAESKKPSGAESKKAKTDAKPEESYVSREIVTFKSLKKGSKDLLRDGIADMLNYGTYDDKKVLVIPGLGKNLKEYSSKPYSWDKLSKIGPCMIKAVRFLHNRYFVHQNLKPEVFAFGTAEKQSDKGDLPVKSQVYLFDVGLVEKYRHSNGSHKARGIINEFVGEITFASRAAMVNKTQSRRDDIESLFYVLSYLAGFTAPFKKDDFIDLHRDKYDFSFNLVQTRTVLDKSSITDIRVKNAIFDFAHDLGEMFGDAVYEIEPEYDAFTSCFDQGLSEKEIKANYQFERVDKFIDMSAFSTIGFGNKTDAKNKMELVMKLMKSSSNKTLESAYSLSFKREIRVYKDLKKGTKHSLIRENVCDMLDHGVYDNRRAIIMPRLGINWLNEVINNFPKGYTFELLCNAARYAIRSLRFVHEQGYLHQDVKLDNFAFGTVEAKKNDKSQANKPLKNQLYLLDFGLATKWRYENKTHKPRAQLNKCIGVSAFICRTSLMKYSQSRRDDMESLLLTLAIAATGRFIFLIDENDDMAMWEQRNAFITKPGEIARAFKALGVDERVRDAFLKYATELNKLFISNAPEYYEKEPDYNAFCACFGGEPGKNACDVN